MNTAIRCCLALVAAVDLARSAGAQTIDFATEPHWADTLVLPAGQQRVVGPLSMMTLAQDSDVQVQVDVPLPLPFTIGGWIDASPIAPPNRFPDGGTQATFMARLSAGEHQFTASFGLPSPAISDTTFPVGHDFSAVAVPAPVGPGPPAVPEPGMLALMLLGSLVPGVAMRRRAGRLEA